MGNAAGVRRDFDALEKRRFAAMLLLEAGVNQSEVARRVKVARQTVARWAQECRSKGKQALKKAGRAGRKPLLKDKERKRLVEWLLEGPERHVQGASNLLVALFTANIYQLLTLLTAGQFTAHDVLRAFMLTRARFGRR